MKQGIVFNVQRFTVHDGPGIRTEIFLKGCSLRCKWCSNPEGLHTYREPGVYRDKCIGCKSCTKVCKTGALQFLDGGINAVDREKCVGCMACTEACPAEALKSWGRVMTSAEVVDVIERDMDFYRRSGGGATFSGGEVLLQWEFLVEILEQCRRKGIHTCVESALNVGREALEGVLPYTDLFITDIKQMDTEIHRTWTGAGNEQILSNIRFLASSGTPFVIRLPIIPNVNDTVENVEAVSDFLNELDNRPLQVQFLRFRRLGEDKYKSLGYPYHMEDCNPDRSEAEAKIKELVDCMTSRGLPAVAGTTQKIGR